MNRRRLPHIACCLVSLAFLAFLALPAAAAAVAAPPAPRLAIETALAADAFGRRPAQQAWSPDGKHLVYLWDETDGKALWLLDAASGKSEMLARLTDLGEEGKALDLEAFSWSPQGDSLLIVAKGDLFLLPVDAGKPKAGKLRRLLKTESEESDARFSPDGKKIAFVRDLDLYVLDVATTEEIRLTDDGRENTTLNGTNDWVYGEEIWSREPRAYWWSPDSTHIAYYHFDERSVGIYSLLNAAPLYPEIVLQKYPDAGTTNPQVKIGVVDLGTSRTTWMQTGDPNAYLARLEWTPRGDAVAIQRLTRDQKRLDLLRCQIGDGACSAVLSENWRTWINLGRDFRFLPDGRFLWGSERSGWRRLYLYDGDGALVRPATPEGWAVTALDTVADDGTWALVTAFPTAGLGPIDRKVARVRLDGTEPAWEVLTPEAGWHQALASPRTGSWVHAWSDANTPPRSELRLAGGKTVALPSLPAKLDATALPKWEFLTIPGPDGSKLPARLLKPASFDPTRRYPVIVYHYGGPGSQEVNNNWGARGVWHKLMAQRGFAVLTVDNQSSLFFGKQGEDRDYRRFGTVNLAGQLAGVAYLKTLPWVDASRLGLWGWSGGGSNTLYCILNRPGVWKAAIAGAPVTDWKLYDSIWTERYLDRPQDNPDGYRDSAPLTYAANLKDHLLIVHGLADDNVHPQNTIQMSDAFIKAGRQFEQAFYPGQKHGFRPAESRHFYQRAADFFERELMGVEVGEVEVRPVP
ncbi:MAG TPA: DPP IV N-terminal domain-containing protein [Thermoanaerobaculia bacterium]|nr:DPP IV N-terminal domain-containing protein [Thermoanaerobaculia bacterium]